MKVLGIAMVKNENDIIEVFVRHNLQYLDLIVVLDNGSTDGTREILSNLMFEGLNLIVIDDPRIDYRQGAKMTDLLKTVGPLFAPDFVMVLDADEFIAVRSLDVFHSCMDHLPRWRVSQIPWKTYLPIDPVQPCENPLKVITGRRKQEKPQFHKVLLPRRIFMKKRVSIGQGSHFVKIGGRWAWRYKCKQIALGHFPVRSQMQILNKVVCGWQSYLATPDRDPEWGQHWKRLYMDFAKNGFAPESVDISEVAKTYACDGQAAKLHDPVTSPCDIKLQYFSSALSKSPGNAAAVSCQEGDAGNSIIVPEGGDPVTSSRGNSGAWRAEQHVQYYFADIPPFMYLNETAKPASVLDLGCGLGLYLKQFKDWGVQDVFGVEGEDLSADLAEGVGFVRHDLSVPLDLGRAFDLVVCTEVIEHINPHDSFSLLDTICKHALKFVLFSAARPKQPGIGHVNCRRLDFWLEEFAKRGWVPDVFKSLGFRANSTLSWFRANPVIMVPEKEHRSDDLSEQLLLAQDRQKWDWHGQKHGRYLRTHLGDERLITYA